MSGTNKPKSKYLVCLCKRKYQTRPVRFFLPWKPFAKAISGWRRSQTFFQIPPPDLPLIRLSYPTSPRFPRAKSKNVEDRDKRKSRTTTHTNPRCIHRDDSPSWNHSCSLRPAGYIYNTGSINVGPRTVWISSLSSWGPRAGPDSTPSYIARCLMSPLVAELSSCVKVEVAVLGCPS